MAELPERCFDCRYWRDYDTEIVARLSVGDGTAHLAPLWQLHRCTYKPAPAEGPEEDVIYTDADYACSRFRSTDDGKT